LDLTGVACGLDIQQIEEHFFITVSFVAVSFVAVSSSCIECADGSFSYMA
jgi:hypothetical protein